MPSNVNSFIIITSSSSIIASTNFKENVLLLPYFMFLKQLSQGDSLNEQEHQIKEYCKYSNFELIEVFKEDVLSGSMPYFDRSIFKKCMIC
jgi:hypothetical protein